jgi:hypothetical protein
MSNFAGYLLKMGGDIFPHKYIEYESYKITPNRRFDLDSTRNANGQLTRYVLDKTASTIEFNLRELNQDGQEEVQGFIRNHYALEKEKKALLEYWSPDISGYKTGAFYVPDVEWTIKKMELGGIHIWYKPVTIKFIEY